MKVENKNRNSQQSQRICRAYDPKPQSSSALSFKPCLWGFRLLFLVAFLAGSNEHTDGADFCSTSRSGTWNSISNSDILFRILGNDDFMETGELTTGILPSLTADKVLSEELDPVDFLLSRLEPVQKDKNEPNIPQPQSDSLPVPEPDIRIIKPQSPDRQDQSQISENVVVYKTAQTDEELPQIQQIHSSLKTTDSSLYHKRDREHLVTKPEHKLRQAGISALEPESDSKNKKELQQIIKQIRSVKFKPPPQPPEPLIAVKPLTKAEPNEISANTKVAEDEKVEPELPCKSITEQTLQIFRNLSQHPEQLHNPLQLADVLFHSGYLKDAAKCYMLALERTKTEQIDSPQNTAWILFQTANCLRNDDPPKAVLMYEQLITEYPDSPWTNFAKARCRLINWYQQDRPRALIDQCRL